MQVLPTKRREENYAERYSRGLWNENGEHFRNLYESNILERQVVFPIVENGCFCEAIALMNVC